MLGCISNPSLWDSDIDPLPCNRYNNAELSIMLRVFLQQVNPARGRRSGNSSRVGDRRGRGVGFRSRNGPQDRSVDAGFVASMDQALSARGAGFLEWEILAGANTPDGRTGFSGQGRHLSPQYLVSARAAARPNLRPRAPHYFRCPAPSFGIIFPVGFRRL